LDNDSVDKETGAVLILPAGEPDTTAATLRRRGDLAAVAVARVGAGRAGLRGALAEVLAAGVARILVAALGTAIESEQLTAMVEREIALHRVTHPEVEMTIITPAAGARCDADWLRERLESCLRRGETEEGIPLSALPPHRFGTIHRLRGGREFVSRLAALGFIPGCPIEVIQNFGVGPLIVAIRNTRIALGRGEADKVQVRPGEGVGRLLYGRHRRHRRRRWHGG
jgi:ferrous iron transport protein A